MQEPTVVIAVFSSLLILAVPRRWIMLPFIFGACLIPTDQAVIIVGLDFNVIRILVIIGVLRFLLRSEIRNIKWNYFDVMVLVWIFCGTIIYSLQWMDKEAVVFRLGLLFDVGGLYWLFRQVHRDLQDIKFTFRLLAYAALVLAPFVAVEWLTGRNPFVALGRVITMVREDRIRCQAAFPHSLMLGLFWATIVPLFIGMARLEKNKKLYWSATAASIFIIIATASSTPLTTFIQVMLLMTIFRYRCYGRQIAYGLVVMLCVLHVIMKAPVWNLIARVNIVGGSTGWHRFYLIDECINHFSEWAILGTRGTSHWGWGLGDVTNQYVLEGVRGGMITLILFVILLVMAVRMPGKISLESIPPKTQWFFWCLSVSVMAHCLSFIGVAYFGQINMLLYLLFAIIGWCCEKQKQFTPAVSRGRPVHQSKKNMALSRSRLQKLSWE